MSRVFYHLHLSSSDIIAKRLRILRLHNYTSPPSTSLHIYCRIPFYCISNTPSLYFRYNFYSLNLLAPIHSTLLVLQLMIHSDFLTPLFSYKYPPLLLIFTYPLNLDMIAIICPASFSSTWLHYAPLRSDQLTLLRSFRYALSVSNKLWYLL